MPHDQEVVSKSKNTRESRNPSPVNLAQTDNQGSYMGYANEADGESKEQLLLNGQEYSNSNLKDEAPHQMISNHSSAKINGDTFETNKNSFDGERDEQEPVQAQNDFQDDIDESNSARVPNQNLPSAQVDNKNTDSKIQVAPKQFFIENKDEMKTYELLKKYQEDEFNSEEDVQSDHSEYKATESEDDDESDDVQTIHVDQGQIIHDPGMKGVTAWKEKAKAGIMKKPTIREQIYRNSEIEYNKNKTQGSGINQKLMKGLNKNQQNLNASIKNQQNLNASIKNKSQLEEGKPQDGQDLEDSQKVKAESENKDKEDCQTKLTKKRNQLLNYVQKQIEKDKIDHNESINEQELPEKIQNQINFKKLIKVEKMEGNTELPFTGVQVEDTVFINQPSDLWQNGATGETTVAGKLEMEMISLECIFYMKDCHYNNLIESQSKINRMGTENYTKDEVSQMTFDQIPINLEIGKRDQSFVKQNSDLMQTKCHEAKVECFLTKWGVNEDGSMRRKIQSESFKMEGVFKPHKDGRFEIQVSECAKYCYIINEQDDGKIEFRMWQVQNLQEVQSQEHNISACLEKVLKDSNLEKKIQKVKLQEREALIEIQTNHTVMSEIQQKSIVKNQNNKNLKDEKEYKKLLDEKVKNKIDKKNENINNDQKNDNDSITKVQVIKKNENGCFFIAIYLGCEGDEKNLEKFILFETKNVDSEKIKTKFQYDCRESNFVIEDFQVEQSKFKIKGFVACTPLKVLLASTLDQPCALKILFLLKVKLKYTNSAAQVSQGYPWIFVDIDPDSDEIRGKSHNKQIKFARDEAKKMFCGTDIGNIVEKQWVPNIESKQAPRDASTPMLTKESKELNPNIHGKLFIIEKDIIDQDIKLIRISASRNFEYVAFINNSQSKNIFYVFSQTYCTNVKKPQFCSMSQNISKKLTMEFVRNQTQKLNQMYFVTKDGKSETQIYSFYSQDQKSIKKQIVLKNLHPHTQVDCCSLEHPSTAEEIKAKITDTGVLPRSLIGVLSLENNSQRINFHVFEQIQGKFEIGLKSSRRPVTQHIHAQYPCVATNLGINKICVHLNKDASEPQCLIYDFKKIKKDKQKIDRVGYNALIKKKQTNTMVETPEIFMSFVDIENFKSLGLDESLISIDTCSRFVFLTSTLTKLNQVEKDVNNEKKSVRDQTYRTIWLNILIIDSFNRTPQVVHFKSSKLFKLTLSKNKNSKDLLQSSILYKNGEDLFLVQQYPRQIFRKKLEPDNRLEQQMQKQLEKEKEDEKKRLEDQENMAKMEKEKEIMDEIIELHNKYNSIIEEQQDGPIDEEQQKLDEQNRLNAEEQKNEIIGQLKDKMIDLPDEQKEAIEINEMIGSWVKSLFGETDDSEKEQKPKGDDSDEEHGDRGQASDSSSDFDELDPKIKSQKLLDPKIKSQKLSTIKSKLLGIMAAVHMIRDKDNILFAVTSDESCNLLNLDFKIEIKQFNTAQDTIITLFTVRQEQVIALKQLADGRFILIDQDGELHIFVKTKNGNKLQRQGTFFMHEFDVAFIVDQIRDYQDIIIDGEILIVGHRVCYLHKKETDVIEGVLESYDLKRMAKSDYEYKFVTGPVINHGQTQFIQIYKYNDSDDVDYYQFRQRIFNFPTSNKVNLINDFNKSCQFSTFLNKNQLLAQFGHRFFEFNEKGLAKDEIEFMQRQIEGDDIDDRVYYAIYWHQYLLENDQGGVNKIMRVIDGSIEKKKQKNKMHHDIIQEDKDNAKKLLDELKEKLSVQNIDAYAVVKVNKADGGLKVIKASEQNITSLQGIQTTECVKQAHKEYFQRYELITMSDDNQYFLFFDNYLSKFQLWNLNDKSTSIVKKFLQISNQQNEDLLKERNKVKEITDKNDQRLKKLYKNYQGELKIKLDKHAENIDEELKAKFQPELQFPPYLLLKSQQKMYIKNYLEIVNLKTIGAKIRVHPEEESQYSIHKLSNLLTGNKTKLRYELNSEKENSNFVDVVMEFKQPQQISAFGFESANNYPHLDPQGISVFVKIKDLKDSDEPEVWSNILDIDLSKLGFMYRFQVMKYLNPNPTLLVEKVMFRLKQDNKKDEDQNILIKELQLSQIIIFKRKIKFDHSFTKVKDIDFWKITPIEDNSKAQFELVEFEEQHDGKQKSQIDVPKNILGSFLKDDKEDVQIKILKCIQFLKQSNVTKHIKMVPGQLPEKKKSSQGYLKDTKLENQDKQATQVENDMIEDENVDQQVSKQDDKNDQEDLQGQPEDETPKLDVQTVKSDETPNSNVQTVKPEDEAAIPKDGTVKPEDENAIPQNEAANLEDKKGFKAKSLQRIAASRKKAQEEYDKAKARAFQKYQNNFGSNKYEKHQTRSDFLQKVFPSIEESKTSTMVPYIIFSFCNQKIDELDKILDHSVVQIHQKPHTHSKMDLVGQIFSLQKYEVPFYFKQEFEVEVANYIEDQKRIKSDIQRQMKKNELFSLKQQQMPEKRRDYFTQNKLQIQLREKVFNLYLMIQVKFGSKWVVIQESRKIQTIKLWNLLHENLQDKENMFDFEIFGKKEEIDEYVIKVKNFQLPSRGSEILHIHFVRADRIEKEDEIQIQAYNHPARVLINATWNIDLDQEVQMYQIKCLHKQPKVLFLYGICEQPYHSPKEMEHLQEGQDDEDNDQEKEKIIPETKVFQGDNGYLLQDDLVIDLKNNIPFIFTNTDSSSLMSVHKPISNLKKMYLNSSRFLGTHQLIFDHTLRDTSYWNDITSSERPIELLGQNEQLLKLFRLKYQGISLFHNFASKYDENRQLEQIITLIYRDYIKAKDEGSIQDLSIKNMPLFLLGPDDTNRMSALQIAIDSKKPILFEMMVGMLKDFDEICSSKMMLGNFTSLVNRQALDYFDKAQFNPPLLQTTYSIEWPDDVEQIVFTCETSLLTQKILKAKIKERNEFRESVVLQIIEWAWGKLDKLQIQFFKVIGVTGFLVWLQNKKQEIVKDLQKKQQCGYCIRRGRKRIRKSGQQLSKQEEGNDDEKEITVTVQALDFDWIFEGENTESFINLLNDNASNEIFNQYSIKVFVQFIWDYYRVNIIYLEFIPYLLKLVSLILLSSASKWNLLNSMKLIEVQTDQIENLEFVFSTHIHTLQEKPDNQSLLVLIQVVLQGTIMMLNFHYLLREGKEVGMEGWKSYFFTNIWNIWGLVTEFYCLMFIGTQFYLLALLETGITIEQQRFWRQISAYAVFMMWIKMFYWAALWDESAYFIIQISKTVPAVKGFMAIYFMIIMAFANFYFILQLNIPEGGWEDSDGNTYNYVEKSIGNTYADAIISMYLASIGEFNSLGAYIGGYNVKSVWMMFLIGTVVLCMIFMNMLIGVMSEPFADVSDNRDAYVLRQKLGMIVTYIDLVDIEKQFQGMKYIMIVKPDDVLENEGQSEQQLFENAVQKTNELHRSLVTLRDDIMERLTSIERNMNQSPEEQPEQAPEAPAPTEQPSPQKKKKKQEKRDPYEPADRKQMKDINKLLHNPNHNGPLFASPEIRSAVINNIYGLPDSGSHSKNINARSLDVPSIYRKPQVGKKSTNKQFTKLLSNYK